MRIWLTTVGEPLPSDPGNERLLRTGILAELLVRQGWEVVWWTSTFNHQQKKQRCTSDATARLGDRYVIRMLFSPGYRKNVSVARIRSHRVCADNFTKAAVNERPPDVILCSYPTLELSLACVKYGRKNCVPVVLDIRDLWPDLLLNVAPRWGRSLARAALAPMFREARAACRGAKAICGVTSPMVDFGLRHANRRRTPLDRDFSFGYPAKPPRPEDIRFPVPVTELLLRFCATTAEAVEFMIRYADYWGPCNTVGVDAERNTALFEKSWTRYSLRRGRGQPIFTTYGGCEDPRMQELVDTSSGLFSFYRRRMERMAETVERDEGSHGLQTLWDMMLDHDPEGRGSTCQHLENRPPGVQLFCLGAFATLPAEGRCLKRTISFENGRIRYACQNPPGEGRFSFT